MRSLIVSFLDPSPKTNWQTGAGPFGQGPCFQTLWTGDSLSSLQNATGVTASNTRWNLYPWSNRKIIESWRSIYSKRWLPELDFNFLIPWFHRTLDSYSNGTIYLQNFRFVEKLIPFQLFHHWRLAGRWGLEIVSGQLKEDPEVEKRI